MKTKIIRKNGVEEISLNRRTAIRERCLNCYGWSPSEVAACPLDQCALYEFRLGKGKQDPVVRSKAIRKYCKWCACQQDLEVRLCPAVMCALHKFRMG